MRKVIEKQGWRFYEDDSAMLAFVAAEAEAVSHDVVTVYESHTTKEKPAMSSNVVSDLIRVFSNQPLKTGDGRREAGNEQELPEATQAVSAIIECFIGSAPRPLADRARDNALIREANERWIQREQEVDKNPVSRLIRAIVG